MRELLDAPNTLFDAEGQPRAGSYRGVLPRTELGPLGKSFLTRLLREKRWFYFSIAADDLLIGAAIIDTTYASSTFAFAHDAKRGELLADHTALSHPLAARVGVTTHEGCLAFYKGRSELVRFNRSFDTDHASLAIDVPSLRVDARFSLAKPLPSLSYIGPIPGSELSTTQKTVLLPVMGEAIVRGEKRSLDGAFGGFDYTHGLMPRHTQWRWAFFQGRGRDGAPVAMNLVESFIGEPECGVWAFGDLHPLGEGCFSFDPNDPMKPWQITTTCGAVDLRFTPQSLHAETKNLGLVASKFVQPIGSYAGTIQLPGKPIVEISGALGVAESQDVKW